MKAQTIFWRPFIGAFLGLCLPLLVWAEDSAAKSSSQSQIDKEYNSAGAFTSTGSGTVGLGRGDAVVDEGGAPWLVVSIRTRDNEYYHAITRGARFFAESIGAGDRLIVLYSEGSSEKQVVDLIKTLKKTGKNAICYIDPNEAEVAPRLAEICSQMQVYFATQWNIPDEVDPWQYDPFWVVHSTPDSEQEGYITARALCLEMGGRGNLLALQGRLGNSSGKGRYKGMMRAVAEFPEIELFNAYVNDWGRVKSMKTTQQWMQRLPRIDGVWAGCDEMALGALEVFRAAGKAGKVKITGIDATGDAVKAVIDGEMLCTTSPDPYWQAGMSLSFAYQAYLGNLNVEEIPHEKRAFYIVTQLIDRENAASYLSEYIQEKPTYNYMDLWKGKWSGPLRPQVD